MERVTSLYAIVYVIFHGIANLRFDKMTMSIRFGFQQLFYKKK